MNKATREALIILGENVVSQLQKNVKLANYLTLKQLKNKLNKINIKGKTLSSAIIYLKYSSYIKLEKSQKGELSVVLTGKGARQYLKYCTILSNTKHKFGSQTLVAINIPEKERAVRDFMRRRLTEAGFAHEASGLYTSDCRLSKNFSFIVSLLGISNYIKYGDFKEI